MYGIVSDIFIKRLYSFFFSICPEYKIQGRVPYSYSPDCVLAADEAYKDPNEPNTQRAENRDVSATLGRRGGGAALALGRIASELRGHKSPVKDRHSNWNQAQKETNKKLSIDTPQVI